MLCYKKECDLRLYIHTTSISKRSDINVLFEMTHCRYWMSYCIILSVGINYIQLNWGLCCPVGIVWVYRHWPRVPTWTRSSVCRVDLTHTHTHAHIQRLNQERVTRRHSSAHQRANYTDGDKRYVEAETPARVTTQQQKRLDSKIPDGNIHCKTRLVIL